MADIEKKATDPTDLVTTFGDLEGTMDRPKSMDGTDMSGTEGIRQDEIQLPRLAIAQGTSPQMVPDDAQFIQGLSIGQMFNDVSKDVYGSGPLTVVPITRHVTRIEFDPNDKKVPIDRDVPAGDPRLQWTASVPGGKKDTPPKAIEYVEFICLLLRPKKQPEAVVVSIKTTNKEQKRAAKLWTTYVATRKGAIYSGMYKLATKIIRGKNKKGEDTMYGVFVVANAGFVPTDNPAGAALLKYAKDFYDDLQGKGYTTSREGDDDDADIDDFDPAKLEREGAPVAEEM